MEHVDITIIGAGVIGLAVASEVGKLEKSVFVLEKNDSWGQEASSRNSEVIHAGIYYPRTSLKAQACCEGRDMLYSICKEHNIAAKKIGKLIVAISEEQIKNLESLQEAAKDNGVDLSWLNEKEVSKLEPEIKAVAALYSKETGIIDSHGLMKHYLSQAQANGAEIVCLAEVKSIEKKEKHFVLAVDNQGERIEIESRVVINCAGNNADNIAQMCGLDIDKLGYRQYYLKGNYFRLSDKFRNKTKHLVYPVPVENSLGIHTVLDLSGGIRLGPDEEEVVEFDYQVNSAKKKDFYSSVKEFFPSVDEASLSVDMAGIRAQLKIPNLGNFKDFIISHEEDKNLSGLINLIGIESPGLTASPYIGKHVKDIVQNII